MSFEYTFVEHTFVELHFGVTQKGISDRYWPQFNKKGREKVVYNTFSLDPHKRQVCPFQNIPFDILQWNMWTYGHMDIWTYGHGTECYLASKTFEQCCIYLSIGSN